MAATSSRGVKICITKAGATPTSIAYTAISKAKPAVVSGTNTAAVGDVVFISGTGFASLDNKTWVAGPNTSGSSLELLGSDTTKEAAAGTGGKVDHYNAGDMICLCWSNMSITADQPSVISAGTYCNPDQSFPSAISSAGQISFGGYVDASSQEYAEMILASEDNVQRQIRVMLPANNGYLAATVTFSALTYSFPLDGMVEYSGSGVLGSKFRHLFA